MKGHLGTQIEPGPLGRDQRGFTLVEIMLALGISTILLFGMYEVLVGQSQTYTVEDKVVELQQGLRGAVTLITHELSRAGYDATDSISAGVGPYITTATATVIAFKFWEGSEQTRTYTRNAGNNTLTRAVGDPAGAAQVVADNVTGFTLVYHNSSGTIITPASVADRRLICAVDVTVTGQITVLTGTPKQKTKTRSITSTVRIRNPLDPATAGTGCDQ